MANLKLMQELSKQTASKIVLVVMDGVGGLPDASGKSELETAKTPNLDALAKGASTGLLHPVGRGITPGSGPGHLALFGYDPMEYLIGRGALSAAGIGMEQLDGDLAIRTNLCTLNDDGTIADRRAGRCATEHTVEVCKLLVEHLQIDGVEVFLQAEKDYRIVTIFRGADLTDQISDVDPQTTGVSPNNCVGLDDSVAAMNTAKCINQFVTQAQEILRDMAPTNGVICRGYSMKPSLPSYTDVYKLRAGAIATYPMYNGLAALAGMEVLATGDSIASEIETLKKHWNDFDYFFFHVKKTDSTGEDGDFAGKVKVIEEFDALLPEIMDLAPTVIAVVADHSTPAVMAVHSWHPVPCIVAGDLCYADAVEQYHERAVSQGILGHFNGAELMPILMATAQKLEKYGA